MDVAVPDPERKNAPGAGQGNGGGDQLDSLEKEPTMTTLNQTTTDPNRDWAIGGMARLDEHTTAIVQLVDEFHVRLVIDEGSDDERHRYSLTFDAAHELGSLLTALSRIIRPAGLTRAAIGFTEVHEGDK